MKRMQYNLLLERGIQFVHCSSFTVIACIQQTAKEWQISLPVHIYRNCLYNRFNAMQWLTIVFFFHLHQRNQNIDLVFGNEENAFPVFVACDSGGYSILTNSHFGIMMLV